MDGSELEIFFFLLYEMQRKKTEYSQLTVDGLQRI